MISVKQLSMLYGSRLLYDEVNLNLGSGNRYALVGANGTGKSTFLRLLMNDESPSLGDVTISKNAKVGWLRQDQFKYENNNILDVVLQGKPKLWQALQEKEELLQQETFDEKSGFRLSHLEEIILENNGYTAETFAQTLLSGLGIEQKYHHKPLKSLSGGFKLRTLLAQALFEEPDILLLDEPTNHLDMMSIIWLEKYLKNEFKGLLLFISHDHYFLNNLATHVLDIDYGEIREYVGNYDHHLKEKQLIIEQKLQERQYLETKIAHLKSFVDRFKAGTRSRQASSREKMLDKMELPDIKKSSRIKPHFHFQQRRPSGKLVLNIEEGLSKSFGDKNVLKNVRFSINRGEKIAIIGHNGIGKSTLLKVLLGKHKMDAGKFHWGHETHIAYFAQDHHEQLHDNISVFDWLCDKISSETTDTIRKTLGQVLFTKDDVHKKIPQLSGGEAARLLFAHMILQKNNILILDEPTNHLDIDAREALAMALQKFEGTVIVVSHDRHFVGSFAKRIISITEQGVTDFKGSYSDYLNKFGDDYLNRAWMMNQ